MKCNKLNDNITEIIDDSGVRMFFIEGKNQAVLIDTGAGFKSLKPTIDSLTNKPYFVILTHGHVDHAGGAVLFDKVYLNYNDLELEKIHCTMENRYNYSNQRAGITDKNLFVEEKKQDFFDLPDNSKFDLGGITLQCIAVPGHTKGMTCILIKELRTLILGDACNKFLFMFGQETTDLSTLKKSLQKLQTHSEEFDFVYSSHGDLIQDKRIILGCINVIDDIFNGVDDKIPCNIMGNPCFIAKKTLPNSIERIDNGIGNIIYIKDKVK